MKPLVSRPVRDELLRLADADPERWGLVCLQIAQAEGWEAHTDPEACRRMVRRRLNGRRGKNAPRNFDGDWLLIVVDHFPESTLAELFVRRAARAEARAELAREVA